MSFNMIIPELPKHLKDLGGSKYLGLIIALFTLSAALSRPFSGKLSDTVGRLPIMIIGSLIGAACCFIYPLAGSPLVFLSIRFVHGFANGFKPTASTAFLADIIPAERRGEGLGLLGFFGSSGMAIGPAVGSEIAMQFNIEAMFQTASVLSILSVAIFIGMKESLQEREKFRFSLLKISTEDLFEPRVTNPCIVMILTLYAFGTILILIPDFSEYLGIENKGLFFVYMTVSSLISRLLAGNAADKYGRVIMLRIAVFLALCGLLGIAFSQSATMLFISASILGLGIGINAPTIFAWAVDLSNPKYKGRGLASLFIALELGVGIGSLSSGWLYKNNPENFKFTFLVSCLFCFMAFLYLLRLKNVSQVKSLKVKV